MQCNVVTSFKSYLGCHTWASAREGKGGLLPPPLTGQGRPKIVYRLFWEKQYFFHCFLGKSRFLPPPLPWKKVCGPPCCQMKSLANKCQFQYHILVYISYYCVSKIDSVTTALSKPVFKVNSSSKFFICFPFNPCCLSKPIKKTSSFGQ